MLTVLAHVALALASASAAPVPSAADSAREPVRLVLRVDSATELRYAGWSAELRLADENPAGAPRVPAPADGAPGAELRLLGPASQAGAFADLARRDARVAPMDGVLTLRSGDGAPVVATLTGVTIASVVVRASGAADEGEDQRATLEIGLDEATVQRDDAARRLAEVEALDRRRLAPANDLAAARARLASLERRLGLAQQRLARFDARRRERQGPVLELVLRARHASLASATP